MVEETQSAGMAEDTQSMGAAECTQLVGVVEGTELVWEGRVRSIGEDVSVPTVSGVSGVCTVGRTSVCAHSAGRRFMHSHRGWQGMHSQWSLRCAHRRRGQQSAHSQWGRRRACIRQDRWCAIGPRVRRSVHSRRGHRSAQKSALS